MMKHGNGAGHTEVNAVYVELLLHKLIPAASSLNIGPRLQHGISEENPQIINNTLIA